MAGRSTGNGLIGKRWGGLVTAAAIAALGPTAAHARPPEIRTHAANTVPACVTPEGLTAFLETRNPAVLPKFKSIADFYRVYGEKLGIRWDYAFYQMVLETNYLKFRRGDGNPGDVSASQNNFAGIGATGGGVPGDRFPDVRTGVLAQMQHLVAYSGERVPDPVAPRTRERQDDIIYLSQKLGRPVTFADLARRWAVDPAYAKSIETVADLYRRDHCNVKAAAAASEPSAKSVTSAASSTLQTTRSTLGASSIVRDDARGSWAPVVAQATPGNAGPVTAPSVTAPQPKPATRPARAPELVTNPTEPAAPPSLAAPANTPAAAPPIPRRITGQELQSGWQQLAAGRSGSAPTSAVTSTAPKQPATPAPDMPASAATAIPVAQPETPPEPRCSLYQASFGGDRVNLIRAVDNGEVRLTALTVVGSDDKRMTDAFMAEHARGGTVIGRYRTLDDAVFEAQRLCPSAAR